MKSYRDLIVWQKSMHWVTLVYSLTSKIPESEKFGLISQIRRSSVSIPSNIAEGYGRNYKKDYSRFLQISRGSLFECQTQIEIALNLGFISSEDCKEINEFSTEIEKMLNSLIRKLIPFPFLLITFENAYKIPKSYRTKFPPTKRQEIAFSC
jgi:four helix bundle protein